VEKSFYFGIRVLMCVPPRISGVSRRTVPGNTIPRGDILIKD